MGRWVYMYPLVESRLNTNVIRQSQFNRDDVESDDEFERATDKMMSD